MWRCCAIASILCDGDFQPEQGSKNGGLTVKMVTEGSAADGLPAGEFNTASLMAIKFLNWGGDGY